MTNRTKAENKGQGLIETILVLPVALAFIALLFFASYRALVYFYADAALHEAMVCVDDSSTSTCERNLQTKLRKVLLNKELINARLQKFGGPKNFKVTGSITISGSWKSNIAIEKEMDFPLRGF